MDIARHLLRRPLLISIATWAAAIVSLPAVTDPEMEPLTAEIDGRLALLKTAWQEGKPDGLADFFAADARATVLWPSAENLETTHAGDYGVATLTKLPGDFSPVGKLAMPGPAATRCETKVIRAEENPTIETDVLVGFMRFGEKDRSEIRAKWNITWKRDEKKILRATTARLLAYQEVTAPFATPPLADRTTRALPEAAAEDKLLTEGNFHWRHHLQASLLPDPFGQNGASVADVNGDGLPDLYLCQLGGLPNQLFLQQADGRSVEAAAAAGIDFHDNTTSAIFVDFDNDGDQDLSLATAAGLVILANDGSGKFTQVRRLEKLVYGFSQAAGDYDRDGDLDLYVCQYFSGEDEPGDTRGAIPVPYPIYDANNGGRNVLLRNDSGMAFADATEETGLEIKNRRFSYAAIWEDWNQDGWSDLVVVNDFGQVTSYRNAEGKFIEDTAARGLEDSAFGMGVTGGDFNRDGWMDLYVDNMFSGAGSRITRQPWFREDRAERQRETFQKMAAGNTLFLNRGSGDFRETGESAGVRMGRWSWGCDSPDLNNDGYEDLLVANGFVTGTELDDL